MSTQRRAGPSVQSPAPAHASSKNKLSKALDVAGSAVVTFLDSGVLEELPCLGNILRSLTAVKAWRDKYVGNDDAARRFATELLELEVPLMDLVGVKDKIDRNDERLERISADVEEHKNYLEEFDNSKGPER